MYLLSHLSSPLYLTWSSKQYYVCSKYVFPVPVVVFLAVVMDDLQSVFSSPWYPLPLSENQSTAIHNYTTTYIFLEIFFANAVKPCFSIWKLANALSAFNALTFWCIGKRIWVKMNWRRRKNIHFFSWLRFSVFYISRKGKGSRWIQRKLETLSWGRKK